MRLSRTYWGIAACAVLVLGVRLSTAGRHTGERLASALPTGVLISDVPRTDVLGTFPTTMVTSPDGKYGIVSSAGQDARLSVIRLTDGHVVATKTMNERRSGGKDGLYYGMQLLGKPDGGYTLYAAKGALDTVLVQSIGPDGGFGGDSFEISNPLLHIGLPNFCAGLGVTSDGKTLVVANNNTSSMSDNMGSVSIFDVANKKRTAVVETSGFPLAVVVPNAGPAKDAKAYVSCERDGVVDVIDLASQKRIKSIRTGDQPTGLLLSADGTRLYVANANSDTVSEINLATDTVSATVLLRPSSARGLPGLTPLGMAQRGDQLFVALADFNALAVVDLKKHALSGYVPTGWYPTAVACGPHNLIVASAKGHQGTLPNFDSTARLLEHGEVSVLPLSDVDGGLKQLTADTLTNNRYDRLRKGKATAQIVNPGIKHVVYIVKENRTYDQILGDMDQANGRKDMVLYGTSTTPNQHALANRFGLFDNFYVCAEMSADGWSWSTAGLASEYVQRNAQYSYGGRSRTYDFEGQNNGVVADLDGPRNVNDPAGGYIWDAALKKGLTMRNYGMYVSSEVALKDKKGRKVAEDNLPTMKALANCTDQDYRKFDLSYGESDAWEKYGKKYPGKQTYGRRASHNRVDEWKTEFTEMVKRGKMPNLMLIRMGNDHTAGTTVGMPTPSAMIADNDYAVGQVVEAISHSPFWKDTAIFILEDDAQGGYDHVDAHRSVGFVVSPYVKRGVDSRFYNTDSMLRTMELLLGMDPMNHYDATALPMDIFGRKPENLAPYDAILPPQNIVCNINLPEAYRAKDSAELFAMDHEESEPDSQLADILWHDKFPHRNPPRDAKHL